MLLKPLINSYFSNAVDYLFTNSQSQDKKLYLLFYDWPSNPLNRVNVTNVLQLIF